MNYRLRNKFRKDSQTYGCKNDGHNGLAAEASPHHEEGYNKQDTVYYKEGITYVKAGCVLENSTYTRDATTDKVVGNKEDHPSQNVDSDTDSHQDVLLDKP